jgi:hypothetical protein
LHLETKDLLLNRIELILQNSSVQQGTVIVDIKIENKPLVSEQLEIRFNGTSESIQLLIFPYSQEKLFKEKQQECLEEQESVLIFIY